MPPSEPFTFVEATTNIAKEGFTDYVDITSAKAVNVDVQFAARLRAQHPELTLTSVPASNLNLIRFADLGYAYYELDLEHDTASRLRGYIPPGPKGEPSFLAEVIQYAKYNYKFGDEYFIIYWVLPGFVPVQYILKEPRADGETPNTNSVLTDKLLQAAGDALYASTRQPGIWVYDRYWSKSLAMYEEVQKSTWEKVILDENTKKSLTEVSDRFFDSKQVYEDLGVPWKRGLLFHGPPGNGKTISIKALMHTLSRRTLSIPTLYVRSAPTTFSIQSVFTFARRMAPCMLVLEDIETIVTSATRSYFFNEVDGLDNNDGILMLASTNFLNRLDPGLSKRPSRFDRKYLFPLPEQHERELYAQFWRHKLENKPNVDFPETLCRPMAKVTNEFSFAYMQEAFVSTLLEIARRDTDETAEPSRYDYVDDIERYLLWRVFQEQVKILRKDMDTKDYASDRDDKDLTFRPLEIAPAERDLDRSVLAVPGSFDAHQREPDITTIESFPTFPEVGTGKNIQQISFGQGGTDSSLAAWGYNDEIVRPR
ncbi:uncharacterized protein HMPREF1541_04276 [Cyphellophora europaea CBS 101466]|uniref:ATPase AAA-type core domain-containing protein n=1 Tax=Cyphellophora europaea (strain CBS 101466) TaxID=1220924 RepID=W2RU24_CYPE1|nr:uncharacterized protein HMPREF1541_04276 [Cyphellophora europaea CBS 101466]ETN40001.1 hypothetical protein HMPREF1541_04276 [Cyphellophora europaea CBS 101466]